MHPDDQRRADKYEIMGLNIMDNIEVIRKPKKKSKPEAIEPERTLSERVSDLKIDDLYQKKENEKNKLTSKHREYSPTNEMPDSNHKAMNEESIDIKLETSKGAEPKTAPREEEKVAAFGGVIIFLMSQGSEDSESDRESEYKKDRKKKDRREFIKRSEERKSKERRKSKDRKSKERKSKEKKKEKERRKSKERSKSKKERKEERKEEKKQKGKKEKRDKSSESSSSESEEDKMEILKDIMRKIPRKKNDIFAYKIDWDLVEKVC